jgi:hypothetical protein
MMSVTIILMASIQRPSLNSDRQISSEVPLGPGEAPEEHAALAFSISAALTMATFDGTKGGGAGLSPVG